MKWFQNSILQFIPMIGSHAFLKVLWWNIVHKSRGNIVLKIEQDHVNMKEWERENRERKREREKEGIAIMCYFFYSTLHSHTTFSGLVVLAKKYFVAFFRKSLSHSSFVVFSEKKTLRTYLH